VHQISDHQQSWGYEDGPWKGPGPPLLVAADFLKFFLISVLSNLLVLMSTGPINHWQVSCLPQPALVVDGLLAHSNKL
jgi:hypothetical protein